MIILNHLIPVDHGQRLAGLDLVPAEGEGEAAGQLLNAAVGLHVRAPPATPALLLLLQTQIQLRHREGRKENGEEEGKDDRGEERKE